VCRPESLEGNRFPKVESRGILSHWGKTGQGARRVAET